MKYLKIKNRLIGHKFEPLIIVELGINHKGSLDLAIDLVDKAINAGAEMIKHQTHIPEDEMIDEAKKIRPGNSKLTIYEIIKKNSLNEKNEKKLMKYVESKKCIFISTPFSKKAADRLISFKVPAFKIGSGECNNYPLIKYISKFKKPIILSTGMNSVSSIKPAVKIIESKKIPYALLHCTNIYPTPANLVRLNCILELKKKFPRAVIGLSDHTASNHTSYAALAFGVSIIEKHFTDTKKRSGPDISASMDSKELKELIDGSKIIFNSLKFKGKKAPIKEELPTIKFAFASVVSTKTINKGEILNKNNIWVKRPGTGEFLARDYNKILGKKATKDIKKDIFIKRSHFK